MNIEVDSFVRFDGDQYVFSGYDETSDSVLQFAVDKTTAEQILKFKKTTQHLVIGVSEDMLVPDDVDEVWLVDIGDDGPYAFANLSELEDWLLDQENGERRAREGITAEIVLMDLDNAMEQYPKCFGE